MKKIHKVAIVDDDSIFTFLTKKNIQLSNLVDDVLTFGSGTKALEFLKLEAMHPDYLPEIIFLDLSMPVLDGWQFLEEYEKLKTKLTKDIVIYILSSSISPEDVEKASTLPLVTDYISKPITKDKFIEIMSKLVA